MPARTCLPIRLEVRTGLPTLTKRPVKEPPPPTGGPPPTPIVGRHFRRAQQTIWGLRRDEQALRFATGKIVTVCPDATSRLDPSPGPPFGPLITRVTVAT